MNQLSILAQIAAGSVALSPGALFAAMRLLRPGLA